MWRHVPGRCQNLGPQGEKSAMGFSEDSMRNENIGRDEQTVSETSRGPPGGETKR